ncbi:hypothetical protein D3C77_512090 [compost metagenome]
MGFTVCITPCRTMQGSRSRIVLHLPLIKPIRIETLHPPRFSSTLIGSICSISPITMGCPSPYQSSPAPYLETVRIFSFCRQMAHPQSWWRRSRLAPWQASTQRHQWQALLPKINSSMPMAIRCIPMASCSFTILPIHGRVMKPGDLPTLFFL